MASFAYVAIWLFNTHESRQYPNDKYLYSLDNDENMLVEFCSTDWYKRYGIEKWKRQALVTWKSKWSKDDDSDQ